MLETRSNLRFMINNFAKSDAYKSVSFSSEESAHPFSNIETETRTKVWKAKGRFQITDSNNKLRINDGSNKEITLTNGEYTSPAALASHIQTQLNASSSNFTVSYSTSTFKFTISRSSSFVLRLSDSANAVYSTLGFVTEDDLTGESQTADENRAHYPYESIKYDLGYYVNLGFVGLMGNVFEDFKISSAATITVEANTIDDFTNPPLSIQLTRTKYGAFKFIDDQEAFYRYVNIKIEDRYNPYGPNGVEVGYIFVGGFEALELRNISSGFSFEDIDPSEIQYSESGVAYSDSKQKYTSLDDLQYPLLTQGDVSTLRSIFSRMGTTRAFIISVDPKTSISSSIDDLTFFVRFGSSPKHSHVKNNYFNSSLNLREAL